MEKAVHFRERFQRVPPAGGLRCQGLRRAVEERAVRTVFYFARARERARVINLTIALLVEEPRKRFLIDEPTMPDLLPADLSRTYEAR